MLFEAPQASASAWVANTGRSSIAPTRFVIVLDNLLTWLSFKWYFSVPVTKTSSLIKLGSLSTSDVLVTKSAPTVTTFVSLFIAVINLTFLLLPVPNIIW